MTLDEALSRPTIPVPEAGKLFFGLGRNAAYAAAKKGEIPTIKIGGVLRVPVAPLAEKLGLRTNFGRPRDGDAHRTCGDMAAQRRGGEQRRAQSCQPDEGNP